MHVCPVFPTWHILPLCFEKEWFVLMGISLFTWSLWGWFFSQHLELLLEQLGQHLGLLLEQLGQQHLGCFVRTAGQQHLDCFYDSS
jgi:hypothetical protein